MAVQRDLGCEYDVVVIGSGYGGSVVAARAAQAGQRVCILEKGRDYRPGDFNSSMLGYAANSSVITGGPVLGPPDALHRFTLNGDLNVYSGCGVGGGSLINAGVALKPDPRIFATDAWPKELQNESELLAFYDRANSMLGVNAYPDHFPYLSKVEVLRQGSEGSSAQFYKPPLTISFAQDVNPLGVKREPCRSCGQCTAGCNYSAKNSLDTNYLPLATNHGAVIFPGICVQRVERIAGTPQRWAVLCDLTSDTGERVQRRILADVVVIAAGALGTNEILHRSKQAGLTLSSRLGKRFSGNGDLLAYIHNANPMDMESGKREAIGPCIAAVHDARFSRDLRDGVMIQEGVPAFGTALASKIALSLALAQENEGLIPSIADFALQMASIGTTLTDRTFSLLAQAHDSAEGELIMDSGSVKVKWPNLENEAFIKHVLDQMDLIARQLGGNLVRQPGKLTTVHPLGGCVMADTARSGVVDHRSRVFAGSSGTEVHAGLYLMDASIIPMALGVNPLLTITALAERAASLMIEERQWTVSKPVQDAPRPQLDENPVAPIGMHFTETMRGFITNAVHCSYEDAERRGQFTKTTCSFTLTAYHGDMQEFLTGHHHRVQLSGFLTATSLSREPLRVVRGSMELFQAADEDPRTQYFDYHLDLESVDGTHYSLRGRKLVRKNHRLATGWKETTTLYVDIYSAKSREAIARGILRLDIVSLLGQLSTMRFTAGGGTRDRLRAARSFYGFFAGKMVETFGGALAPLKSDRSESKKRPLRAPESEEFRVLTGDGIELPLYRFRGGSRGPVVLLHAAGVSASMFFLDKVETNLVEFLTGAGFDVWVGTYRTNVKRSEEKMRFGFDEIAHHDHPAMIAKVLETTGAETVQVVGFCAGSTSFLMSLLAGHLKNQVRSMVCLQTSLHFEPPKSMLMDLKLALGVARVLESIGIHELPNSIEGSNTAWDNLWDLALKLHPYPSTQQCLSRTCQRTSFVFGNLLQHEQLNRMTHETLSELWAPTSVSFVRSSENFFQHGFVVNESGEDVYLPQSVRLSLPIAFLHGSENAAYGQGTEKTYHFLCALNGDHLYERHILSGYGHLDAIIGKNAARDVYPLILEFLKKTESK